VSMLPFERGFLGGERDPTYINMPTPRLSWLREVRQYGSDSADRFALGRFHSVETAASSSHHESYTESTNVHFPSMKRTTPTKRTVHAYSSVSQHVAFLGRVCNLTSKKRSRYIIPHRLLEAQIVCISTPSFFP
jgi:hypothetical protein